MHCAIDLGAQKFHFLLLKKRQPRNCAIDHMKAGSRGTASWVSRHQRDYEEPPYFVNIEPRDDTQRSAASGASTSLKFDGEVKQWWLPSVLANSQGVTRTVRLVFLPDTFYFARVVLVWLISTQAFGSKMAVSAAI